jgi:hypothetical protein
VITLPKTWLNVLLGLQDLPQKKNGELFLVVASVLAVVAVKLGTKSEMHQQTHIPEVLQPCRDYPVKYMADCSFWTSGIASETKS